MMNKAKSSIIRLDYDYNFFASETKAVYSLDINSKIAGIAADATVDIDTEWANFIKDNEGMWKPLQDELTATFCK